MAGENAAKAALALLGMVGRTHEPATLIADAIADGQYPDHLHGTLRALVAVAERLGPEMYIRTDYGEERTLTTPWELFGRAEADAALTDAREALRLADIVVTDLQGPGTDPE